MIIMLSHTLGTLPSLSVDYLKIVLAVRATLMDIGTQKRKTNIDFYSLLISMVASPHFNTVTVRNADKYLTKHCNTHSISRFLDVKSKTNRWSA